MSDSRAIKYETSLAKVAADYLARNPKFQSISARTFSIDLRVVEHFTSLVSSGRSANPDETGHPVSAMVVEIGARKVVRWLSILCWTDGPRVILHGAEIDVPDGKYLIVISPIISDGDPEDRVKTSTAISAMVGTLGCMLGRSIIYDLVTEVEVFPDGKETASSEVIRTPQPWDILSYSQPSAFDELTSAIKVANGVKRQRVLFGLSTVGRALMEKDERFRFLEYWIAMEVLADADGIQKEVQRALATAYGSDDKFVLDNLELRAALRMRSDIVHFGKRGDLTARLERLLQCYCLDLARHHLGLPCGRFAEGIARYVWDA